MSSYLVLARKYRPQRFDELVGQEHVARTLTNAIALERVHHAFLFTGARGVGKTSAARILAKALCCAQGPTATPCGVCDFCREIASGSSVDVLEIDGASNTSVDDVRTLRESARYAPSSGRRKVYIIDEVHMLSTNAFNALLKTLEEPPPHVVFIFATTEVHKNPDDNLVALPTLRLQAHPDHPPHRAPRRRPEKGADRLRGRGPSPGGASGRRLGARRVVVARPGHRLRRRRAHHAGQGRRGVGGGQSTLAGRHPRRRAVAGRWCGVAAAVRGGGSRHRPRATVARVPRVLARRRDCRARAGRGCIAGRHGRRADRSAGVRGQDSSGAAWGYVRPMGTRGRRGGEVADAAPLARDGSGGFDGGGAAHATRRSARSARGSEGRLAGAGGPGSPPGGGRASEATKRPAGAPAAPAPTQATPTPGSAAVPVAAAPAHTANAAPAIDLLASAGRSQDEPVGPAEAWRLARLRFEDRPSLAAALDHASMTGWAGGVVTLAFGENFTLDQVEKNRATVERVLTDVSGNPTRLVLQQGIVRSAEPVVRSEVSREHDAAEADRRRREKEAREHPIVRKAQEVFGVSIREVKTA